MCRVWMTVRWELPAKVGSPWTIGRRTPFGVAGWVLGGLREGPRPHSMIFHSYPHLTSVIIHFSPAMVVHGIRFYHSDAFTGVSPAVLAFCFGVFQFSKNFCFAVDSFHNLKKNQIAVCQDTQVNKILNNFFCEKPPGVLFLCSVWRFPQMLWGPSPSNDVGQPAVFLPVVDWAVLPLGLCPAERPVQAARVPDTFRPVPPLCYFVFHMELLLWYFQLSFLEVHWHLV